MIVLSTNITPGFYQYTYPTFVDTPKHICVHFLTPDGQQAFVSYPNDQSRKAARLIPISWFNGVDMIRLAGHPCLMAFLETLLTNWFSEDRLRLGLGHELSDGQATYEFVHWQAA